MRLCKELFVALAFGVLIAMLGVVVASLCFSVFLNSGTAILGADEFEERISMEIGAQYAIHSHSPSASHSRR